MSNNSYKVLDIKLHNFRNYKSCHIETEGLSVLLSGHNGAGKTSILEAISYFTPGRGIKGASLDELKHKFTNNWAVSLTVECGNNISKLSTGLVETKTGIKRVYKVDDENVKSSQSFLENIKMLWLTPQIDSFFMSSAQNRRKFLDRIIYNFDYSHAEKINQYEKKIKERSLILKMPLPDEKWLDILEQDIARLNVAITLSRKQVIDKLNKVIFSYQGYFPRTKISLKCEVLAEITKESTIADIVKIYEKNRKIDKLSGRTNFGCHRSDLDLIHYDTERHFNSCSTGEQKSMIIGTLVFQTMALRIHGLNLPILLLDEIMTHLDENKRIALIQTIKDMNIQAFITSTLQEFWDEIKFPAKFFHVENAGISEFNRVE